MQDCNALDYQGPVELLTAFSTSSRKKWRGSPYMKFPECAIDPVYVSNTLDPIYPMFGPALLANQTYADAKEQFDIILIPGGMFQPVASRVNLNLVGRSLCSTRSSRSCFDRVSTKTRSRCQTHSYCFIYLYFGCIRTAGRPQSYHEQIPVQVYCGKRSSFQPPSCLIRVHEGSDKEPSDHLGP